MGEFTKESTTDDVLAGVDLSGQRIVVTGASSGLGEESTRAFAAAGASVTMAARDSSKLEAASDRVRSRVPDADVECRLVDLANLSSIRSFTDEFLDSGSRLDVLLNNAGVMACPQGRTTDGFETQFGTNHLGHFLLTCRLVPALLASAPARVVQLSSGAHMSTPVDFDDPNFEHRAYSPWEAYGQSKTANALFALELDRRLADRGVRAFSVHPGMIATELGRHLTRESIEEMHKRSKRRAEAEGSGARADFKSMYKPVEVGAATQVWAATGAPPETHGGAYLADCQLGEPGGDAGRRGVAAHARDPEAAQRLWSLSESLVGESFDF